MGMIFLPAEPVARHACERLVETAVVERGCEVLGWRDVTTDDTYLGDMARRTRPVIRQLFVMPGLAVADVQDPSAFERRLYVIRKSVERAIRGAAATEQPMCHRVKGSAPYACRDGLANDLAGPANHFVGGAASEC